jgi:hypothetical protein
MMTDQKSDNALSRVGSDDLVRHLDEALNQVVKCTDGYERRLVLIEERLLHYQVQISGGSWMRLSGTRRWEAQTFFIGGTIMPNDQTVPTSRA